MALWDTFIFLYIVKQRYPKGYAKKLIALHSSKSPVA